VLIEGGACARSEDRCSKRGGHCQAASRTSILHAVSVLGPRTWIDNQVRKLPLL
jgi:hypothetical protein